MSRPRFTLARAILAGLLAGVATGLFLGEYAALLGPVGSAYIALLQMTVLPYITVTLIVNIGALTGSTARHLAARSGLIMLALWCLGLGLIVLLSGALPEWETASFFSTSLIEPPEAVNYLELYIPSNPFSALARSLVPAVVLFSIAVGAALIAVPEKERLLAPLRVVIEALGRVNRFVIRLTPVGVFAMAASAAGTMTLQEFGRLQGYLLLFVLATLLLVFWFFPMLVAAVTPVPYLDLLRRSQEALITAFATDNVFIVLPQLIDDAKALVAGRVGGADETEEADRSIDVVMPIAFTFPHLGKLMAVLFIPFAAWYVGQPLPLSRYPAMVATGLLTLFGKATAAIPFLLDMVRLPADLFQLFLIAGIPVARFGSLAGAMNLLAFAVLVACATTGALRVQPRRTAAFLVGSVLLLGASIGGARAYLSRAMSGAYDKDRVVAGMQLLRDPVQAVVLDSAAANPVPLAPGRSRLDRVRERGVLRAGFLADNLPFSYFNAAGDLVGLDLDMAHTLARDLGVTLELVPTTFATAAEQLQADHFDLVMSAFPGSVTLYERMRFTRSFLQLTPALLVPDHRRDEFATHRQVLEMDDLTVGLAGSDPYLERTIRDFLPDARIEEVPSVRAFLEGQTPGVDALVTAAERGAAWSLLYPSFGVSLSLTEVFGWPMAYPVASDDPRLAAFLDSWLELKEADGTVRRAYDHWILGRDSAPTEPRWSVLRDVLHWVD